MLFFSYQHDTRPATPAQRCDLLSDRADLSKPATRLPSKDSQTKSKLNSLTKAVEQ